MDILACGGSIHHYSSVGWLLPEALQVPRPKGGLVAFEPVSQRQQLALGLEWINELLSTEDGNDPLSLTRARSQLLASMESLQLAASRGEISGEREQFVAGRLEGLLSALTACQHSDNCTSLKSWPEQIAALINTLEDA